MNRILVVVGLVAAVSAVATVADPGKPSSAAPEHCKVPDPNTDYCGVREFCPNDETNCSLYEEIERKQVPIGRVRGWGLTESSQVPCVRAQDCYWDGDNDECKSDEWTDEEEGWETDDGIILQSESAIEEGGCKEPEAIVIGPIEEPIGP